MTTETGKAGREQRLAAQLRENLRRRKAQARELAAGTAQDQPKTDPVD